MLINIQIKQAIFSQYLTGLMWFRLVLIFVVLLLLLKESLIIILFVIVRCYCGVMICRSFRQPGRGLSGRLQLYMLDGISISFSSSTAIGKGFQNEIDMLENMELVLVKS
ncbi:hypothetical protein A1351_21410 [Methylosinus sp. R-45379]|nr:hypothetical protein A1351_21410 [Methylosinus sp. R-45379]